MVWTSARPQKRHVRRGLSDRATFTPLGEPPVFGEGLACASCSSASASSMRMKQNPAKRHPMESSQRPPSGEGWGGWSLKCRIGTPAGPGSVGAQGVSSHDPESVPDSAPGCRPRVETPTRLEAPYRFSPYKPAFVGRAVGRGGRPFPVSSL